MHIQSKQNERFKNWKKLLTKKGRRELQQFIVEGEHLVGEALHSGWQVEAIICTEEYLLQPSRLYYDDIATFTIDNKLFQELVETSTPQGIIAVLQRKYTSSLESIMEDGRTLLLLDQVNDPGNLGTIIRTADAAGVDAVILGKGTVDPFSGKVLRATQGSIFHLPIFEKDLYLLMNKLQQEEWKIYGTSLKEAIDYRELQATSKDKIALLMGNEANGVEATLLDQTDMNIKIPIWGKVESLNVAIATGILLYHVQAQRK